MPGLVAVLAATVMVDRGSGRRADDHRAGAGLLQWERGRGPHVSGLRGGGGCGNGLGGEMVGAVGIGSRGHAEQDERRQHEQARHHHPEKGARTLRHCPCLISRQPAGRCSIVRMGGSAGQRRLGRPPQSDHSPPSRCWKVKDYFMAAASVYDRGSAPDRRSLADDPAPARSQGHRWRFSGHPDACGGMPRPRHIQPWFARAAGNTPHPAGRLQAQSMAYWSLTGRIMDSKGQS
jgi:hypothetical protein